MLEDDDYGDDPERRSLFWPFLLVLMIASLAAAGIIWKGDALDPAFTWVRSAVASVSGDAGAARGASSSGQRLGAWVAHCDKAAKSCTLAQDLRGVGDKALDASWRIEARGGAIYSIWSLPTGIMVRTGMMLGFDDKKPVSVPFDSCDATSCEVMAKITPAFVETMRAARASIASVTLKGGGSEAFTFSHAGLADGLALLPVPEGATAKD
jgi:invasion protein IalB